MNQMNGPEAVFNQHVNNAGDRAREAFIDHFGRETYLVELKKHEDNGIMSIFNEDPNTYTIWYVKKVQEFVNEPHDTETFAEISELLDALGKVKVSEEEKLLFNYNLGRIKSSMEELLEVMKKPETETAESV